MRSKKGSHARTAAVAPMAILVGLGLLVGAAFDGMGSRALLPIAVSNAIAGIASLLVGAAWAARIVPRGRADDVVVLLVVLAVVPNAVSVLTRHAAGGSTATTSFLLALVPLAVGAVLRSRPHYLAAGAVVVGAFVVESVAVGAFDPLLAGALGVSLSGGWIFQSAIRSFERARNEAEAARAEVAEQRARAERLATLGALVGSLSHGINNPLMVIGGNVETARMSIEHVLADPTLEPARRAAIEDVVRSLGKIEKANADVDAMMRALLLLAETRTQRRLADVHDLLEDALVLAQIRVPPHVEVAFERGPPMQVGIDARDLFQLVLALLADAGDACSAHGGRVDVSTRQGPEGVFVLVEDASPTRRARPPAEGALSLDRALALARAAGGDLVVEHPAAGGTRRTLRVPGAATHAPSVIA